MSSASVSDIFCLSIALSVRMVRLVVEDMSRDNHHHDESDGEEGRHPVTAHDERNGSEDDSRRTAGGGRAEPDDQPRDRGSHAHRQQDDEQDRQPYLAEKREHADEPRREAHHQPYVVDDAVDERADFAFGMLVACQPHQQCAQYGEQHPQDVPFRILEIIHRTHDQERREDGHVTPDQERPSRVAQHTVAGVVDHAADERDALGGIQLLVFHSDVFLRPFHVVSVGVGCFAAALVGTVLPGMFITVVEQVPRDDQHQDESCRE